MNILILARPKLESESIVEFLKSENLTWSRTKNATELDELIEFAGRICYLSFGPQQSNSSNSEFIKKLIKNEHTSIFEHIYWSFLITGVSRAFSHQLVRHRVGFSFSQLSQQFYDETNCDFILPPQLEKLADAQAIWRDTVNSCKEAYSQLQSRLALLGKNEQLNKKTINNIARSILPNSTETKIVMTANARALRHFFRIRGNVLCDYEMRYFSSKLLELLKKESAAIFHDFSCITQEDGTPCITQEKL